MDDLLAGSAAERRFAMILFEAFAIVALALAAIGVAIGLGGAALASRAIATLLFGVSRLDPIT